VIAALIALIADLILKSIPVKVKSSTVSMVSPAQQFVLLNATGFVQPQRKAAAASKASGRLEWLGVREGSTVKEGEIIARLDKRDVEASRQSARANVRVAEANVIASEAEFEEAQAARIRAVDLAKKGFVSSSAVDSAKARESKARAGLASARAGRDVARATEASAVIGVDDTVIRAPFDGIVLSKTANVGDIVTPMSSAMESKGAVVTIADLSTMEVEADVSESSLSVVNTGQPCEIRLDAFPDLRLRGAVDRIVPTIDRSKATATVKVRFVDKDPRILPEMSARVAFLSKEVAGNDLAPILAVNPDAITNIDDGSFVFVIRSRKAFPIPVLVGAKLGDMVAVNGALKAGDRVILKPDATMKSGKRVAPAMGESTW
jgi:RND family efflux transporter MFP subunit